LSSIILPVVLYGCETWSVTLKEEHILRVFENRVLRRTFGTKREEVVGGWRRLYNEEHHNLYSSPNIVRVMKSSRIRWAGHVAYMGEMKNKCNILTGKPEGKRPLGKRLGWEDVDWIHLAQDMALVNAVMNLRFHLKAGNFLTR
jgi:hypothetical protein